MPTSSPSPAGGSPNAAAVLHGEREALLRYVVKLLTPDVRNAEDIVQETLLRAWLRADRLDWQDRPIRPWLFRTAHNLAVDFWRKDRAVPAGIVWTGLPDPGGADDVADRVVDRRLLVVALRRLPRPQHEVLVYVHMLGLDGAEIAETLRIPRGTVKSRTHNALRSLRRELDVPDERTAA